MAVIDRARETVLPNGLRIVTLSIPAAHKFIMEVSIGVGSIDDGKHPGVSHFLEHMKFAGTPTRDNATLSRMFGHMGGNFGASTQPQRTIYKYEVIADPERRNLSTMVETAADVQFNGRLPQDRLEHEREVIINEMGFRRDNDVVGCLANAHFLRNTSVQTDPGGLFKHVRDIQAEHLQAHIDQKYCARLATIYLSGPASHDDMAGAAAEYFGIWRQTGYQPQEFKFDINPLDLRIIDPTRIQNAFTLYFLRPNYSPADYAIEKIAMDLVNEATFFFRQRTSQSYVIMTGNDCYERNLVSYFSSNSAQETTREYVHTAVKFIASIHDHLDPEYHKHAVSQTLRTLDLQSVSGQDGAHSQMAAMHFWNNGQLYDQGKMRDEISNIRFADVRDYIADKYSHPVELTAAGPTPDMVPSLLELSEYFRRPLANARYVIIPRHHIKPDIA